MIHNGHALSKKQQRLILLESWNPKLLWNCFSPDKGLIYTITDINMDDAMRNKQVRSHQKEDSFIQFYCDLHKHILVRFEKESWTKK